MIPIDMWDFREFVRACVEMGQTDEIIKILTEENVIPQGEWIKIGELGLAYKCDKCEEIAVVPTNFCSNCGARMSIREDHGKSVDPVIAAIRENNSQAGERPEIDFTGVKYDLR